LFAEMSRVGKGNKMVHFINYQMKVTVGDGRVFIGRFMAYDKHINVVLGDTVEYRKVIPKGKTKREERDVKRVLGLIVLRGESIVSISVEGPPLHDNKVKKDHTIPGGPGRVSAIGRGVAVAPGSVPSGLGGPALGVGGPAMAQMMPQQRLPPNAQAPIGFPQHGGPPPGGRGMPSMVPPMMMGRGFPMPPASGGGPMGRGGPPPPFMGGPMSGPPGMMGRGAGPGQ